MNRVVSTGANGVLNLRGARIRPNVSGHVRVRTQLRWMINPAHGMPSVFTVWRRPMGGTDKKAAANGAGWEPIETVGLPIDSDWPGYPAFQQGPISAPMSPFDAALQRLKDNAPSTGWAPGIEDWKPPSVYDYLKHLTQGQIFKGLRSMMDAGTPPSGQIDFPVRDTNNTAGRMLPKLQLDDIVVDTAEPGASTFYPFRLMCLSASADPLAALAFGFGTGFFDEFEGESSYMVTFVHTSDAGDVEFADIVWPKLLPHPLDPPTGLTTTLSSHTRPQRTDGAAMDSIAVGWTRVLSPLVDPNLIAEDEQTLPASYAIGRTGTGMLIPRILLTKRPSEVGGWLPYVPSTSGDGGSARFQDHVVRELSLHGSPPFPYPGDMTFKYFVAAQDLYGRWSQWRNVDYTVPAEPFRKPQITGMRLVDRRIVKQAGTPDRVAGVIEIDFAWDWSDRSPGVIELRANWEGAAPFDSVTILFDGKDTPSFASAILPLSLSLELTETFGSEQDNPERGPGTRHYRWRIAFADLFPGGEARRVIQAQARGSMHIYSDLAPPPPFGNFTTAHELEMLNPLPPPGPAIVPTEAPLWASLPDTLGISRFDLTWPTAPSATGYHIYEATETSLLSALQLTGPDLAEPFTKRLRDLRQASIGQRRHAFRRITDTPLTSLRHEVSLPRGSRVIHMFTVLAQNGNSTESEWPTDSGRFIAVAAPRQVVPPAPALFVTRSAAGAKVEVQFASGDSGDAEVYRTQSAAAARGIDSMGPIHRKLPLGSLSVDDPVAPSWKPYYYRALVWSKQDLKQGLLEARSATSPLVTLFMPPAEIGPPTGLAGNLLLSTPTASLVTWQSDAPLVDTPLGKFQMIIEVRDGAGGTMQKRLVLNPATLPAYANFGAAPGPSAEIVAFRLTSPPGFWAWMPRPASASRHLTVKIIDPRGPLKSASIEVPPLTLQTVTIPPWKTQREVEDGDDMGVFYQGATALGLGVNYYYEQKLPGHFDGEVVSTTPAAGTVVSVGTVVFIVVNIGDG